MSSCCKRIYKNADDTTSCHKRGSKAQELFPHVGRWGKWSSHQRISHQVVADVTLELQSMPGVQVEFLHLTDAATDKAEKPQGCDMRCV